MAFVFTGLWTFFSRHTNIWDRFSVLDEHLVFVILYIVFALALFIGFYIYRLYFSVTFFYLYVTACVFVMPRFLSWVNVVAFFSVTGVMFAFLIYKWHRLGSLVLCGAIGGMLGYMILPENFFVVIAAFVAMAITFFFPVHGICIFMALFGGLGLSSVFVIPDLIGIFGGIVCGLFQIWLTRKQTLFDKKYPSKIQYMLDKRKAAA